MKDNNVLAHEMSSTKGYLIISASFSHCSFLNMHTMGIALMKSSYLINT